MSLDYTLFIQLGIFLYVLFVLNFLVFRPVLKIINRRDALTVGRVDEAAELQKKMSSLQESYDSKIKAARESLDGQRRDAIERTKALAEKRLSEAKDRIERQTLEKRALLEQNYLKVRERIPEFQDAVAQEIVRAMTSSNVVKI